jgi:predicted DNA-binding transcriptional regulator AlpA
MKFLRFKDLKQRGVVRNWTTLSRLVREQGFPPGVRIGAQARAWGEDEIEAWLRSRRIASSALRQQVPVHAASKPLPRTRARGHRRKAEPATVTTTSG